MLLLSHVQLPRGHHLFDQAPNIAPLFVRVGLEPPGSAVGYRRELGIFPVAILPERCAVCVSDNLAGNHGLKLISDSAQSFGSTKGKPTAIEIADVPIYSTGFPKVFRTGSGGGIVVRSKDQVNYLEQDPSGILRHESLPEVNAYLGLRALDRLPRDLDARVEAARTYISLLGNTRGVTFQRIPPGSETNYHRVTVKIDAAYFGLDAKGLYRALEAENILCITDRMLSLDTISRIVPGCKIAAGALSVSERLGESSITLPVSSDLTPDMCQRICACIHAIHHQAKEIATPTQNAVLVPTVHKVHPSVVDIGAKFRDHWAIPIIDENVLVTGIDESTPWTVFVRWSHLTENSISIEQLNQWMLSKRQWNQGDKGINSLYVHAKFGDTILVLSPRTDSSSDSPQNVVYLDESGSLANVALVFGRDGALEVHKTCSHEGIDGNGCPWLRRQAQFFESSVAVRETGFLTVAMGWLSAILDQLQSMPSW